jgi:uncharacterized protein (TIGR03437 family)
MLYMVADDNPGGIEQDIYTNVKDAERAGGSDDNVNVVVMLDGKYMITQATLGNGALQGDAATTGLTWQFQLGSAQDTATCKKNDKDVYEGVCYITMLNQPQENPLLAEQNMGDPNTLKGFINWAKTNYSAEKYALIIGGHGGGWRGIGFDATWDGCTKNQQGNCVNPDPLYMGELSTALTGSTLELIGFDACLMAMTEVAYQVRPYANYMVASEEIGPDEGWPFEQWVGNLKANAQQWTGLDLATDIVRQYGMFYGSPNPGNPDQQRDPIHTLSAINEAKLPDLVTAVSSFAKDLTAANDDFQTHDTPADNVQNRILLNASKDLSNSSDPGVERYGYYYLMDLGNFASRIKGDPGVPNQYKGNIDAFLGALNKSVIAKVQGKCRPQATGLSIFMPLTRTRPVRNVVDPCTNTALTNRSYDNITAGVDTGDSQKTTYAANIYKLPLQAQDPETKQPLQAPRQFPRLPAPNFLFATETQWPAFLQRFYRPVANNHILQGANPDGSVVMPISMPSGQDEITVSPGARVSFSGAGSSSADTPYKLPLHWMWDFDDQTKSCNPCIAPYDKEQINPGADAAFVANDHMDADRTGTADATNNQKDADAQFVNHVFCQEVRDYIVTLNVWDDNHTFNIANPDHSSTYPDASYVHIQTAGHTSVVHCRAVTAASIAATSGTPQSANVNTAFSTPLQATVTDAAGKPVSGVQVMFTAPTSGPGALFGGQSTTTVATDAQGHATATITANSLAGGPYAVVASAANVTGSAIFVLANASTVVVNPNTLVFTSEINQAAPSGQTVQVAATVGWTVSSSASWLSSSPASGSASGPTTVSVNPAGLATGVYTGSISITGSDGSVAVVLVTYTITDKPALVITPHTLVFTTGNNTVAPAAQTLTATSTSRTITYRISAQVSTPSGGTWLQVSSAQGQTTGSMTVRANPEGLSQGVYAGSVVFTPAERGLNPVAAPVTLIVGTVVEPTILAVVNGASFQPGGAPRAIMTIFGTNLSDATYQATSYPLPAQLGPTTVTVNGLPAPLFYVSPTQINSQMSSGIEGTEAQIVVSNQAAVSSGALRASPQQTVTLTAVDPGLFVTPDRRASALNGDLSPHTPATPVPAGGYIILFISGAGPITPPLPDGTAAPLSPLSLINAPLQVTIGGQPAQVTYQGVAPGFAGLEQLNVIVPPGLTPGDQPAFVTINGVPSNAGLIRVK